MARVLNLQSLSLDDQFLGGGDAGDSDESYVSCGTSKCSTVSGSC